jgi:hypothetical protein
MPKTRKTSKSREIHLEAQMKEISDQDWEEALNMCVNLMQDTKQHVHDIQIGRGENMDGIMKLYNLRINYLIKCIRKASKMMKAAYPMDVNIVSPKYD